MIISWHILSCQLVNPVVHEPRAEKRSVPESFAFLLLSPATPSQTSLWCWLQNICHFSSLTWLSCLHNCPNGLLCCQATWLPPQSSHALVHTHYVHWGPTRQRRSQWVFSEYLKELDLILFTDGPKSWVKVFTLSHLNSFLISAPRFCETTVTCASSFSASFLKRPRIRGRQIYIWQLLWENMALSWL